MSDSTPKKNDQGNGLVVSRQERKRQIEEEKQRRRDRVRNTNAEPDFTNFTGTYMDTDGNTQTVTNLNLTNFNINTPSHLSSYIGFHYSANDVSVTGVPNPDGTTVYNIYYDRDLMTFNFYSVTGTYTYTSGYVSGEGIPCMLPRISFR